MKEHTEFKFVNILASETAVIETLCRFKTIIISVKLIILFLTHLN